MAIRTQDGREYTARAAGVDRHTDTGLLKITDKRKGKWLGLKLSDARTLPPIAWGGRPDGAAADHPYRWEVAS